MMRIRAAATAACLTGALWVSPSAGTAQIRADGEWWSWALPAVLDGTPLHTAKGRITLPRTRPDGAEPSAAGGRADGKSGADAPGRGKRKGGGPPFCANGRGHPVHGLEWCRDKGWDDDGRLWQRATWPDVIFGRREPENGALDRRGLGDVLGDVILGRVDERSRYLGLADAIVGRFVTVDGGGSVLQIRSGDVPVAELTDADGDGRVDGTILLESL